MARSRYQNVDLCAIKAEIKLNYLVPEDILKILTVYTMVGFLTWRQVDARISFKVEIKVGNFGKSLYLFYLSRVTE